MTDKKIDIAIIGAGPVGMFATFYSHLRNANTILIDGSSQPGGQLTSFYPKKNIIDIPGFIKITGEDLIKNLSNQLNQFKNHFEFNNKVINVSKNDEHFNIQLENGDTINAKKVILSTGKGFLIPKPLPLKDYDETIPEYLINDFKNFENKNVLVAGGGDSAVDHALSLVDIAKKVTLIHRRDVFSAMENNVQKLDESNVDKITSAKISKIERNGNKISVEIIDKDKNSKKIDDFDKLIVSYGFKSNSSIENWDVDINFNRSGIEVNQNQETNIKGIFAIGDASYYDGKSDLIATGFGEAPLAVNNALLQLNPSADISTHSTSMKID